MPQGCSQKEKSVKMGKKKLVSSASQSTYILVNGGQKYHAKHNAADFGAFTILSRLVTA
jgi:hypothetical protein